MDLLAEYSGLLAVFVQGTAEALRRVEVLLHVLELELVLAHLPRLLGAELADRLEGLGVACGREDVIELLLEDRAFRQRPVGFLLVHEDDVLQNGLGNSHHGGHEAVHVRAAVADGLLLARGLVHGLDHRLEGLVFHLGRALRELEGADDHDGLAHEVTAAELDLPLDLRVPGDLGVVDEGLPAAGVGREVARARHLEALDDGRLPGPVLADDEGQRLVELDHVCVARAEAPDALDEHLVD
mmetsp:Transcript_36913/g.116092  ORF Transcript_36913/g.116092 Transcript_36913/m.116092 type:complete len:241 (+) Transcript_36913:1030-1752(+)